MSKIVLFSSSLCPECPPVIEKLNKENIDFENIDITESMANLKKFLRIRDKFEYFKAIKENNKVGVPTIMDSKGNFYDPNSIANFSILK